MEIFIRGIYFEVATQGTGGSTSEGIHSYVERCGWDPMTKRSATTQAKNKKNAPFAETLCIFIQNVFQPSNAVFGSDRRCNARHGRPLRVAAYSCMQNEQEGPVTKQGASRRTKDINTYNGQPYTAHPRLRQYNQPVLAKALSIPHLAFQGANEPPFHPAS